MHGISRAFDGVLHGKTMAFRAWRMDMQQRGSGVLHGRAYAVSELDLGLDAVVSATDTEGVMVDAPFSLAKTPRINIGLLALAQYRAYVAQTSIADPRHFLDSVRAAMEYTGGQSCRSLTVRSDQDRG